MPHPRAFFKASWRHLPRNVVVLGCVSFLNDVASESVVRILPLFLRETARVSFTAIGWVEGVADSLSVLLRLVSGWLADVARGKKIFMALGYGLSALIRPFFPAALMAFGWGGALVLRAFDRVGKAVRTPARDALIALESDTQNRGAAFGFNRALDTFGAFVGVILAAMILWREGNGLSAGSFRSVITVASVSGFLAVALVLWGVRETPKDFGMLASDVSSLGSWRGLPGAFYGYLACVGLFTLAGSSDAFLLIKLREAGFSLGATLIFIAAYNAVGAITAYPISHLSDGRYGRKTPILIGWGIYAAAYGAFGLTDNPAWLGICFVGYGLYYGCVESTEKALVSDLVPRTHLGRAYGLFGFVTGLLLLPANLIFGLLSDRLGSKAAFLGAAVLSVLAALGLVVLRLPKTQRKSPGT